MAAGCQKAITGAVISIGVQENQKNPTHRCCASSFGILLHTSQPICHNQDHFNSFFMEEFGDIFNNQNEIENDNRNDDECMFLKEFIDLTVDDE